jgi:large subunit ribosomal protein L21
MYAIIETGGKQYKVCEGSQIRVEKINSEVGAHIELDKVIMVGDCENPLIGTPFLKDCKVIASVVDQAKGPKILIFKKKRRKGYRRAKGHRQNLTKILVENIVTSK